MKSGLYLRLSLVAIVAFTGLGIYLDQQQAEEKELNREPAANGFEQNVDFFAQTIYRSSMDLGKLPVKLAVPIIARFKIDKYVDSLPMNPATKKRIRDRLNRKDFVDAVIPFAMALKDQYMLDKDFSAKNSFETYIKGQYQLSEDIPGLRHSLFDWGIKDGAGAGKTDIPDFSLDKNTIARLIELYDVLFLKSSQDYIFTSKKIRQSTISEAVPLLRNLLKSFADRMPADSDTRQALASLMDDQDRLEAVVISGATFLRGIVQRNYHAFAYQLLRQQDLKFWLTNEYNKKDFGDLYRYMIFMNQARRFGVQVVVDGLQGKLLESLSRGRDNQEFFKQLVADERNWKKEIEDLKMPMTPVVGTSQEFLHAAAMRPALLDDPRYLPYIKNIFSPTQGYVSSQGVSTTPTISVRNLPIVKTGADVAGPGGTGIPNFHFVDRQANRAYYFYGNDALLLEDLAKERGMKTMAERLKHFNTLNCSAQYDEGMRKSFDALLNLVIGEKSRDFGELLCLNELTKRVANENKLREMRETIADNIREGRSDLRWVTRAARTEQLLNDVAELSEEGMPEYLLMYIPWPDHFAHFKGPFSDELISPTGELNRLDYWLGRFSALYDQAGVSKNTLWTMAGDHGLIPVYYYLNPEKEVFAEMQKEGTDLVVKKISSDEGGPPMITHPYRPPSMKGKDIIVASTAGGNYMIDLFNSQDDAGWKVQPTVSELKNWRTLKGQEVDIVEEIRRRLGETLDYMVIRSQRNDGNKAAVAVISTRAGSRVSESIQRSGDRYFYAGSEADLLDLHRAPKYRPLSDYNQMRKRTLLSKCVDHAVATAESTWCDRAQWLELTALTDRPDSVVQLVRLYDEDRAGTINLFPRAGFGYNTIVPGRHAGEQFHEKDAFVGMWGAGVGKKIHDFAEQRRLPIVNGSLAPTEYEYLTGQVPEVGKDGWGFPSMFELIRHNEEVNP